MTWTELALIALGLSMDAFAVAVCKGMAMHQAKLRHALGAGAYFGVFQGVMPCIGFALGQRFTWLMASVSHWIAFGLLGFIGLSMIREGLSKKTEPMNISFSPKAMVPLALATSIDALATGVTFAFMKVKLFPAAILIACITFMLATLGLWIGRLFGSASKARAELFGGAILLLMAMRILIKALL